MDILLKDKHGIIISCNFSNIEKLEKLVKETCSLDFIQGYKIGRGITEDKDYKTDANKFWKVVQERTES